MQLGLQNGGLHLADGQNFTDLRLIEVRKPDGADFVLLVRLFHLAVASHIGARRLADEKEVNIIGVEAGKRLVHRIRLLIKARPQLRFQENSLARKTRLLHRAADRLFMHIGVGGVDQAIAILQGADAGSFCLVRGE